MRGSVSFPTLKGVQSGPYESREHDNPVIRGTDHDAAAFMPVIYAEMGSFFPGSFRRVRGAIWNGGVVLEIWVGCAKRTVSRPARAMLGSCCVSRTRLVPEMRWCPLNSLILSQKLIFGRYLRGGGFVFPGSRSGHLLPATPGELAEGWTPGPFLRNEPNFRF